MTFKASKAVAGLICLLLLGAAWAGPVSAMTILTMSTGRQGGSYYAFGQVFAQTLNAASAKTGIRIKAVPSAGSVANINGLSSGKYQLALSQADIEYLAWTGLGPWAKAGKQIHLRSIYGIYTEGLACVASQASGIKTCADLKGKRVALGAQGSGTMVNAAQAIKLCMLTPADLGQALYISPNKAMRLMFDGKLDAFFYMVGHPNVMLQKFLKFYGRARLVPFRPTEAMKDKIPYYVNYFIWKSDYPALRNAASKVDTFGIETYIACSDRVPSQVIHEVARQFMINLPVFKKRLPFMKATEVPTQRDRKLSTWNLSAPYHQGVIDLFTEMGLVLPASSPVQ